MEGIARSLIEADNGTTGICRGRPARRLLIGGFVNSDGRWRLRCAGAYNAASDKLPFAGRAFKDVYSLHSETCPYKIVRIAIVALGVDKNLFVVVVVIMLLRPFESVVALVAAAYKREHAV